MVLDRDSSARGCPHYGGQDTTKGTPQSGDALRRNRRGTWDSRRGAPESARDDLALKQAWWRQALAEATLERFPMLRKVNWFEWTKHEPEVDAEGDWTVTSSPDVRDAFVADLPAAMLGSESLPDWCRLEGGRR